MSEPTKLDPEKYWQLRTLSADLELAQTQLAYAQMRVEQARAKRTAYWAALATEYKLNPDRPYGAVDESCSLVEPPTTG